MTYTESVVMFGPAQSLVGVLTMPETPRVSFAVGPLEHWDE